MNAIVPVVVAVKVGRNSYPVATVEAAQRMYIAARDRSGNGVSRVPPAILLDATGAVVGYVSYNGRAWHGHPRDWHRDAPMIAEAPSESMIFDHNTTRRI